MLETMRNRVAFAICQHAITVCCWRKTGENAEASKQCASCQSAASAVLKAMHAPTDEMIERGNRFPNLAPDDKITMAAAWNAMIEVALREQATRK